MLHIFAFIWQLPGRVPIPTFNENGLLPPGVHLCTLQEIRTRFGTFQSSDHRSRLFAKLEGFVEEVRFGGIVRALIIDGSFVTNTSKPNDIDLILVLAAGHDFAADLMPSQYKVMDRAQVRRAYGFDAFIAEDGSTITSLC